MGVRGEKRVRGGEISPRRAALGRLLKALGAVAGGLLLRARFFCFLFFFSLYWACLMLWARAYLGLYISDSVCEYMSNL